MKKIYILTLTVLFILFIVFSELHSNKTKQQIQNDLHQAEERLENSKE